MSKTTGIRLDLPESINSKLELAVKHITGRTKVKEALVRLEHSLDNYKVVLNSKEAIEKEGEHKNYGK